MKDGPIVAWLIREAYDFCVFMDATVLWKIRGYLVLAILLTLFVIGGAGYLVDLYFHSAPKGLIAGVLISFPVANILAIRFAKAKIVTSS